MNSMTLRRHHRRVHFADQVGLSLIKCKEFYRRDRPMKIQNDGNSSDDDFDLPNDPAHEQLPKPVAHTVSLRKFLSPTFPQPACTANFFSRVAAQHVSLENIITRESHVMATVLVQNLAFEKRVFVRYTADGWKTFSEVEAKHATTVRAGAFDRFSFLFDVPDDFPTNAIAEFAVRYEVNGQEYWDNNGGANYSVQCYSMTSTSYSSFSGVEQQARESTSASSSARSSSDSSPPIVEPRFVYPRLPRVEQIIISI